MYERYAEGIATGRDEGIPIGFDRGITVGFDRGSHDARVDTARNLLSMGFPLQQTAQATGLSLDEVQSLL